jgi:tryptophan-rich sensory protein
MKRWQPVLVAAAVALLVALVGGTMTDTGPWYQGLNKPSWQPPGWLFGPAWTLIFALTVLSAVRAWRAAPSANARLAVVALYCLNGVLNVLWSAVFFALRRPDQALVEVVFLWLSVLVPMLVVRRWSPAAAWLLLPYLAWVAFAGWLNLAVVRLNGPY